MAFVIDASVAVSWYLAEEDSAVAKVAFERLGAAGVRAPVLWWFEVRNALVINERRGRLDMAATVGILTHLESLPIQLDVDQDGDAVLALARGHRLTVYGGLSRAGAACRCPARHLGPTARAGGAGRPGGPARRRRSPVDFGGSESGEGRCAGARNGS